MRDGQDRMSFSASRLAARSLHALPREGLSRALGRLARVEAPDPLIRALVRAYCRAYGVDMSDYEVPAEGFASFDEFFTRRLRPGVRAADPDPNAVLAPADGRLDAVGPLEAGATVRAKGHAYTLAALLGDEEAAAAHADGWYAVVYLSPRDYHRVHAPVSGPVASVRYVPGTLFPVNDLGHAAVDDLFVRNERVVVTQHSERHGRISTVMVGAMGVGHITLSFDASIVTNVGLAAVARQYGPAGPYLERGAELGTFHLGSTVVVLGARGISLGGEPAAGVTVRLGDALARRLD
jgi:phosphatidylserine decarboxylase